MEQDHIHEKKNNPIVVSVIAYCTLVGWLIAALLLNRPRDPFTDFHVRQALGINLLLLVSGIVFIIPLLGWIAGTLGYLAAITMWITGVVYALQGREKEVPFLGDKFQEWFEAF
ncbi:MAG: DUF4870 domain-containing protein [Bacteroidota bacterium]